MRLTKQCHSCKQQFKKSELVDYASPGTVTTFSYCPDCLREKLARERFSNTVCSIFGIKTPGPRIWTERKRLHDMYGYTDDIIVDTLEYIYYVENMKKLSESLCLVTPTTVEKMKQYKRQNDYKATRLAQAMTTNVVEHIVPIKENVTRKKELNPDDYLD